MGYSELYQDLTVVILAGGQSKRMGSDKGFLPFSNSTFSSKVIALGKSISDVVIVSVGDHNHDSYSQENILTIRDEKPETGPMGGVISVLPHIKTSWFLVISVDTPMVNQEMISELWMSKERFEAVVFESGNRIHPLVGLYHISTKGFWSNCYSKNNLKVTDLVNQLRLKTSEANSDVTSRLKNINTPDEYKELIELE